MGSLPCKNSFFCFSFYFFCIFHVPRIQFTWPGDKTKPIEPISFLGIAFHNTPPSLLQIFIYTHHLLPLPTDPVFIHISFVRFSWFPFLCTVWTSFHIFISYVRLIGFFSLFHSEFRLCLPRSNPPFNTFINCLVHFHVLTTSWTLHR